jgi:hypothetical protein
MVKITVSDWVGSFAENKEKAKRLRTKVLLPALCEREDVTIDFADVSIATQSFVHALIAEAIRSEEYDALDLISFANCNENVQAVIEVVVGYCQDDWAHGDEDLDVEPDHEETR